MRPHINLVESMAGAQGISYNELQSLSPRSAMTSWDVVLGGTKGSSKDKHHKSFTHQGSHKRILEGERSSHSENWSNAGKYGTHEQHAASQGVHGQTSKMEAKWGQIFFSV